VGRGKHHAGMEREELFGIDVGRLDVEHTFQRSLLMGLQ